MKLYVGITDKDWFKLHASKESLGEVNFWRPSHQPYRKDFQPGMPFLFKLHAPDNAIVGGGFFLKFLALPLSLAWGTLGEANGARTLDELRGLISKRRTIPIKPNEDPIIGCTILGEPFFFDKSDWFPGARYVKPETVSGKGNFDSDTALELWREVTPRLEKARAKTLGPATVSALDTPRYGSPALVAPRLGQGSFRALVTDAYHYRCAITLERTLPVLQAAHIRPYSQEGTHELSNGLLLRSDLHTLFDLKYMTIDPNEKTVIVSRRIREEFENGRAYYELMGRTLANPQSQLAAPSLENLRYHFDQFCERESARS